ncbi:MAG TPA: Holliday junction resolvase RuvX, partial [SAR86 cluster bacterium]|nr:Holliday junction resolvase RuvX [SAR86 cluster bacterium]
MVNSPRVVIAFDFGLRNIGVAIGQEVTKSASTFYVIKAKEGEPDWKELDIIIEEWNPNLLVVGDPLNMDG